MTFRVDDVLLVLATRQVGTVIELSEPGYPAAVRLRMHSDGVHLWFRDFEVQAVQLPPVRLGSNVPGRRASDLPLYPVQESGLMSVDQVVTGDALPDAGVVIHPRQTGQDVIDQIQRLIAVHGNLPVYGWHEEDHGGDGVAYDGVVVGLDEGGESFVVSFES